MPSTFRRLLLIHKPYAGRLSAALAALALLAAARLALTWLGKLFADGPLSGLAERSAVGVGSAAPLPTAGLPAGGVSELGWLVAGAALLVVLLAASVFVARALLSDVERRVQRDLRDAAVARLLRARRSSLVASASGDLAGRLLADVPAVAGFADLVCRRLVGETLVAMGAIGIMLVLAPRLALGLALTLPLVAFGLAAFSRGLRRLEGVARSASGALGGELVETLRGATTLKLLGHEERAATAFAVRSEALRRLARQSDLAAAAMVAGVWLITGLAVVAILAVGASQLTGGGAAFLLGARPDRTGLAAVAWLTPGELLAFCLAAVQVVEPVRRYADALGLVQRLLAAADRVFTLIDWPALETEGGEPVAGARGRLELVGVHFGYGPERPVLRGVDLVLAPREQVALVGASGAGKSTLAALLVRLEEPDRGLLTLDGRPLAGLELASLRAAVCLVEQDSALFSGTLAEALRLAAPEAGTPALLRALSLVGLDRLLAVLPGGLEGRIGEGGRTLSGGERQRLALARALLRDPPVLVLDEATSALDGETEAAVFARLAPWMAERTLLVVAHRLATVRRLPRVVLLAAGRVVGDGPFATLLAECPEFAALVADQVADQVAEEQGSEAAGQSAEGGPTG